MVRAIVLVKAPMVLLAAQVRRIPGVKNAFDVRGRFDCVALVSVADIASLKKTLLRIQAVKGVGRTETLVEL